MVDEFKNNSSAIEEGVTEDDAKQACTLCLNDFKKSALTPFDLNKDGREYLLCSTCLSKVNGTYQNPQGSGPATFTTAGGGNFDIFTTAGGGNFDIFTTVGGENFDVMRPTRHGDSLCSKCLLFLLVTSILSLVAFIFFGVRYFPTPKWKSIEGTINKPCQVEYEIDGQLYTHTTKFNCEELGPYKLKYNPKDPSDAISAGLQDQDEIMLIFTGLLVFIGYLVIVTYFCQRYDVVPMLKRTCRRS